MRFPTLLLLTAALAGCGGSPRRGQIPGLRTELTLLDPEPTVGSPLRVRLTLVNDGPERVVYRALGRTSFGVVGPDNAPLPYIDGPRSTGYGEEPPAIEPGSRVVVVDEQDLADLYLISKPGRHTIRSWGGILWARRASEPAEDELLSEVQEPHYPPNAITVDLRPGVLPLKLALAERLYPLTPKDWHFACDWWPNVPGPDFSFIPFNFKSGLGLLRVRAFDGPPEKNEIKLLDFDGRPVYVTGSAKAEALWPDWRARVAEALRR